MSDALTILLFGASGSAGGGVLGACLRAPNVGQVRAVVRKPLQVAHPKLRVVLHQDFLDYGAIAGSFDGVDACFFCLGTSVTQVPGEAEYRRITRDFAMAAAGTLKQRSPEAAFHFISGQGTNAKSMFMWARVKAEAERDLRELVGATSWRPSAIDSESSSGHGWVRALKPAFKLLSPFRSLYVKGDHLGRAMLQATREGMRGETLENVQIRDLADRAGG